MKFTLRGSSVGMKEVAKTVAAVSRVGLMLIAGLTLYWTQQPELGFKDLKSQIERKKLELADLKLQNQRTEIEIQRLTALERSLRQEAMELVGQVDALEVELRETSRAFEVATKDQRKNYAALRDDILKSVLATLSSCGPPNFIRPDNPHSIFSAEDLQNCFERTSALLDDGKDRLTTEDFKAAKASLEESLIRLTPKFLAFRVRYLEQHARLTERRRSSTIPPDASADQHRRHTAQFRTDLMRFQEGAAKEFSAMLTTATESMKQRLYGGAGGPK
jgi:hypothetical protein